MLTRTDGYPPVNAREGDDAAHGAPQQRPLISAEESDTVAAALAPPQSRAPHNERAADVVVEGSHSGGGLPDGPLSGDGDAAVVFVATETADPHDVRTRTAPRRKMGEVYPIMKNTIYSDDECEEEVALTAWDCGAIFIRYINGLFQYFVRNPKVMGLLFTSAIVLLFFKYSQQQVVKVVNAAVKAHPGLEPTDILRSAVVSFTDELRALERVAQTVAWAYHRDSVSGSDISTAVGTTFVALTSSFQSTFTSNIKTYVVYPLLTAGSTDVLTAHWGQIGCASEGKEAPVCYYVDNNYTARQWVPAGSDDDGEASSTGDSTATGVYVEERMPELLTALAAAKKGTTLASTGMWTRPSMTQRIFSDTTTRTISYLIPITFNDAGYATAMAGVDVSVETLMDIVNVSATPNIELVVVDNRYNTNEGGQFVYDSFDETLFWSRPYGVRDTPVSRINALADPIYLNNGNKLAANASFYQNGLIYQSLTMMEHWTLIASSPLALSVAEVVASLGSIVKEGQSVSKTAASLYRNCEAAANAQSDSMSVEAFAQVEHAFGTQLHSLYMSYTLAGTDTSSSSRSSGHGSSSSSSSSSSALTDASSRSSSASPSSSSSAAASSPSSSAHTPTTAPSSMSDASSGVRSSSSSATKSSSSGTKSSSSGAETAASSSAPAGSSSSKTEAAASSHADVMASSSSSSAAPATLRSLAAAQPAPVRSASVLAMDPGNSSETPAQRWGVCGCTYSSSSSSETTCFYTDSNQLETIFEGSVLSESPANATKTHDFTTTRRSSFTNTYIAGSTATEGFWTVPYVSNDTVTGEVFVAVSYVYPSSHQSSSGLVSRAAILDTTAAWMMQALKANQHAGTTALYLIDRRNGGIFLASSTQSAAVTEVYSALETPDSDFNRIAAAVYSMAGSSWETSLSFHLDGTLVNYQVVLGQWGVIEVMPGETALQRYLPTPAVEGATDAIRLLPLGETVELFLYVSAIIFLYFLNLLILGCSKLGKR